MNEDGFVASGGLLVPRGDIVGFVAIDDFCWVEVDEKVEVGKEGSIGDLGDLHCSEVALDCAWERPSHGGTEVVGVHPGVDEAVEDAEDCRHGQQQKGKRGAQSDQ